MQGRYLGWRAVLWFVAIYHVAMGAIMFISGELTLKIARVLGGVNIQGSPELGVLSEILACYVIAFGLMMALAAWNPLKYRGALTVGLVLFGLRTLQRFIYAEKSMDVFHVPLTSHYAGTVSVIVIAGILGYFRFKIAQETTD